MSHLPVLLNEVMEYLDPNPSDVILDATIGCGGHSTKLRDAWRNILSSKDNLTPIESIPLRALSGIRF